MVAIKKSDIGRFLSRPDKSVVLVYGPDIGLVRERADALIKAAVDDPADPFGLARLDGDALAEQPERLLDEAHTIPLFGGRRAVRVKVGSKSIATAIERLLAAPPGPDCRVVIEAGDLRSTAPLRTQCERSPAAAAIPCYADDDRDLGRLIDDELSAVGLSIDPDARTMLIGLLGGDRAASRSELGKLALYAHGKTTVSRDDIFAVVADATSPAVDALIDDAFAGNTTAVEQRYAQAAAAGISANTIIFAASRHAAVLHRLRLDVDAGSTPDSVVGRPGAVHFSRKAAVERALRAWSSARLERLIPWLGDVSLDVRRNAKLADTILQRALLLIAREVRRRMAA